MTEEKNEPVEILPAKAEIAAAQEIKPEKTAHAWYVPLFAYLLFSGTWYLFGDNLSPQMSVIASTIANAQIKSIFSDYSGYFGLVFGLVSLIICYILFLPAKLFKILKYRWVQMLIVMLSVLPWIALGYQLVYKEKKYIDIAKGLIAYCGEQLIYCSVTVIVAALIFCSLHFIIQLLKNKKQAKTASIAALLLAMPFLLTGCVGDFMTVVCDFLPDSDHCEQGAAAQEGKQEQCEQIKGEKFKDGGSNPPRDKCYLMIAENSGDMSACEQIKGGFMSYTREECLMSVARLFDNPSACDKLTGASASKCKADFEADLTPEKVIALDDQIDILKNELKNGDDKDLSKQLKKLEAKRLAMYGILSVDKKAEYEKLKDPISQEIIGDWAVGDIDSASKNKLLGLNERLKAQGLKMTTEQYEAFKDYYAFMNDPANDITKMDDSQLVKDRWNEKVGNMVDAVKIWKTNPTKEEQNLDEQLRFYQRMLERQEAINNKLSELGQDVDRNIGMIGDVVKSKVQDEVKDKIIESLFGEITKDTVGWATKPIEEALDTVQSEAKSMEFRGLVKAYDDGMAEEMGKSGGNIDKAHAEVLKNLQADAYHYASGDSFAKYGNILENKDCDGTNPHCINREVFWKAMKKSYSYQNPR
ncbi:MAG: hypothetical protein WCT26_03570 [Candidatus Buchananbacteria bacterium]|jgi:hypothetical protein